MRSSAFASLLGLLLSTSVGALAAHAASLDSAAEKLGAKNAKSLEDKNKLLRND